MESEVFMANAVWDFSLKFEVTHSVHHGNNVFFAHGFARLQVAKRKREYERSRKHSPSNVDIIFYKDNIGIIILD